MKDPWATGWGLTEGTEEGDVGRAGRSNRGKSGTTVIEQ